jgi:hypothetical protein
MQKVEKDNDCYIFKCPQCSEYIIVNENDLNCKIFRHGVYKDKNNLEQMDPHSTKNVCNDAIENNKIYGCGKPFCLKTIEGKLFADVCEYI